MKLEKVTCDPAKAPRRYNDACGMAYGLELLGDRWALFIVRELMLGPRRFNDLRADLPGISANVLTQRLSELEAKGIVVRRKLPPPANVAAYELTPWGYEAEPIVQELGRWAVRSPGHDPTLPISGVSILLSLRTMIDRSRIGDLKLAAGFRFGADEYLAEVDHTGIVVARGDADAGEITFDGRPEGLAAFIHGGADPDQLAASGALAIRGDPALARRFAGIFVLPPKLGEEI